MNFKNIFISTLSMGALFFIPAQNHVAIAESNQSSSNQKTNISKPRSKDGFNYSQNINHIFLGARIITQFSPRNSQGEKIELDKLASELGYDHFNWVNYVEKDPHGIADTTGKTLKTPYNDPPEGGYPYDFADQYPFYWDVVECDRCRHRHHFRNYNNLKQFELVFEDAPADYRLQPGEAVEFITHLVGVTAMNSSAHQAEWDILHTFRWKLTNPHPNYSQVTLMEANVDLSQLSPVLLNTMVLDGATIYSHSK